MVKYVTSELIEIKKLKIRSIAKYRNILIQNLRVKKKYIGSDFNFSKVEMAQD